MTIPFIFVAFIIRRSGKTALSMLAGILPIALLFLLFQDADHSRLYPILLVIAWVLSIVLGHYLGGAFSAPSLTIVATPACLGPLVGTW